jgi:TonB-dependent receptor
MLIQIGFLLLSIQAFANDPSKVYRFDIPAQSLVDSLATLSLTTERLFLFPYDLVENKNSKQISGLYTAQKALELLLADTGLVGELASNHTFTIKPDLVNNENNQLGAKAQSEISLFSSIFAKLFPSAVNEEQINIIEDGIDVIEVTGSIRASYLGSVGGKRIANTVVEVLTSDVIGEFVDDNIAGTLQRTPGLQVEVDQSGTTGDRVSIRGLGPQFVNSSINGRTLLSSGNQGRSLRKMNFNVFPPPILNGVRVAKAQVAIEPEGGLAGQVNLITLRPLDLNKHQGKQTSGTISYKHNYRELGHNSGQWLDGVYAWRNATNDFAFYFGGVISNGVIKSHQASEVKGVADIRIDNDGDGVQDNTLFGVTVPSIHTARPIVASDEREAFSTGFQWKPNDDIDIVWDTTFARYNSESLRNNGQFNFKSVWVGTLFQMDAIELDEDNVVRKLDFSQSDAGGRIFTRVHEQIYSNYTDNLISGINVDWVKGDVTTNFDIYYSGIEYFQDLRFPVFTKDLNFQDVGYENYGITPSITIGDDIRDNTAYSYLQSLTRDIYMDGKNQGATLIVNHLLDSKWLASVDLGIHYEQTSIDVLSTDAVDFFAADLTSEQLTEIMHVGLTGAVVEDGFLAGLGYNPTVWLTADYDAVAEIDPRLLETGLDILGIDPERSHISTEKQFAVFGQLNIDTELGNMAFTGNIGLRAVKAKNTSKALDVDATSEPTDLYTSNDHWRYLPSVNLKVSPNDKTALRFAVSQALSRPDLQALAPTVVANVSPDCIPEEQINGECKGIARIGNPDLKPMKSINFDITYEYYNDYDGAAVVSLFYKKVSDFIISFTQYDQFLDGQDPEQLFDISQYINFSDGQVKGYEIGFHQPFDKIIPILKGFGLAANYTKVNSSFEKDVGNSGFGFPGASENSFNFSGYYEYQGLGVRLAYVYRDDFFRSLEGEGTQTVDARFTGEHNDLSANIRYKYNKSLMLMFNGSNLLDEGRRDYLGIESKYIDYLYRGRSYDFSVRYSF